MKKTPNANSKGKKSRPETKLGIPDLEMSKVIKAHFGRRSGSVRFARLYTDLRIVDGAGGEVSTLWPF
jgi:hypothetical protein